MRHALILSIALAALATAAQSQHAPVQASPADGQAAGLRYISWAGKPAALPAADAPAAAPLRPAVAPRAAPRIIPHAGAAASTPTASRGLTPADAWTRPSAPPVVPAAAPPQQPVPQAPPAVAAPPPADDPMAPRRDAAIFRMGTEAAAAAPAPARQPAAYTGAPARYYSLHRQNGRQPDAIAMPAPVYLDALPVEMDRAPQTEDLAEPPAAPMILRDVNGRIRPAAPPMDDGLQ